MMTTARVVVTTTPLSLKVLSSPFASIYYPAGILSTSPNAIAPLIIPPYDINSSSLIVTSVFF